MTRLLDQIDLGPDQLQTKVKSVVRWNFYLDTVISVSSISRARVGEL